MEATCTVVAVSVADGTLQTNLTCTPTGSGPHAVVFEVAAPAAGQPVWAVDDVVSLRVTVHNNEGGLVEDPAGAGVGTFESSVATLHGDDGALLVVGASGLVDIGHLFAPIQFAELGACAEVEPCSGDPSARMQFSLTEEGGNTLVLTGGQHGELALADGTTLVVDAPEAIVLSDCHFGEAFQLAARRMQL